MKTRTFLRTFCGALWLASGCSAESTETPDPGTNTLGDPEARLGGFVVDLQAARDDRAAYTAVLGKVYDGPVPSPIVWTVVEEGAGCRLLAPRVPFCSPGCGGVAVCVEDDRCEPYPTAQNLGQVQVTGLGSTAFAMDPISGSYQPRAGLSLPYPPFQEGSAVQMRTSGGGLPAFSIASRGITPLAVEGTFALASGRPLPVAWSAPADSAGSRIEVKLDISHHGGTKGKVECDVADSGSLVIPQSQVSQLLALGVAGFPTIQITRVASGTAALSRGTVSLRVTSGLELPVEIPGLRSCTRNDECPAGQSCRDDLSCG